MMAIVTQEKKYTIEQYAHYVLDDPKVTALIDEFTTYQKAADIVIDTFENLLSVGDLKFDTEAELTAARNFSRATEKLKNDELRQMLVMFYLKNSERNTLPPLSKIVQRGEAEPHPNKTDIPAILFGAFVMTPEFQDYFIKGSVPELISGAYFAKDMDIARQKYMIFAVFLWLHTEARGKATYYDFFDRTEIIPSGMYVSTRVNVIEQARLDFLRTFKDYIHFDLWDEDDYEKREKTDTVLRLRLDQPETGYVVIQTCGDRPNICNREVFITPESVKQLQKEYLSDPSTTPLRKLGTFLNCDYCGKQAYLLKAREEETHFYCALRCYNRC